LPEQTPPEPGAKDLKGAPRRIESAIKSWELMGGKLLAIYSVMGVCVRERVKTTTLRASPLADLPDQWKSAVCTILGNESENQPSKEASQ